MPHPMDTRVLRETIQNLRNESLELKIILRLHQGDIPEIHSTLSLWSKEQIISCFRQQETGPHSASWAPSINQLSGGWPSHNQPAQFCPPSGPRAHNADSLRYSSSTNSSLSSSNQQSQDWRFSDISYRTSLSSVAECPYEAVLEPQQNWSHHANSQLAGHEQQSPCDDTVEDYDGYADYYLNPSDSGETLEPLGTTQQMYAEFSQPQVMSMAHPAMHLTHQGARQNFMYSTVPPAAPTRSINPNAAYQDTPQLLPEFTQSPAEMSPHAQAITPSARASSVHTKPKQTTWCPYRGCGKPFSRQADFQQHVLGAHERTDSYICAHCGVRYNRISDLRSHHSQEHRKKDPPDCDAANTTACERHEAHPRKPNWGCRLCKTLLFGAEAWFIHHTHHVVSEKKQKADGDFSTLIYSLLSQNSIGLRWDERMKAIHAEPSTVRYEWDEETSDDLLHALEWGDFLGKQISQSEDIELLIDHAIRTGTAVSTKKRPASSSPRTLYRMMVRNSANSPIDVNKIPSYDNGVQQPHAQPQSQKLVHR